MLGRLSAACPLARRFPRYRALATYCFQEANVEEKFQRGSGKGGQAVNKLNNCVLLRHLPSGIVIRCHRTRSLELNRKFAREELHQRLQFIRAEESGARDSKRHRAADKVRRRKSKQRARAKAKYASPADSVDDGEEGAPHALESEDGSPE